MVTDHKALTEIRKKGYFNNNRANKWADLIQENDFEVKYKKGEDLFAPSALTKLYEGEEKTTIRENVKKLGKWGKHVATENGREYWIFTMERSD